MEQKAITAEIKAADDGTFEGYASVFGVVDSYGDIVQAGAFAKTLTERKGQVKLLWNHDGFSPPIGKFLDLREDGHGLRVKGKMSGTPRGQEVLQLMREGAIDSMSIGYTTIKYDYEQRADLGREVRNLREVRLYEASPVVFPANEAATITAVKRRHEAEALLVQVADFMARELKAGRTLSAASLQRIHAALGSIQDALGELEALTADVEPSEKARITPAADEPLTPTPKHSPVVAALTDIAAGLQREQKRSELLAAFRATGAQIGEPYARREHHQP